MQNKANLPDTQMNVTTILTKDYEKKTLGGSGKNKANSKPNKANLQKAQMNVSVFYTKDYENILNWAIYENKANLNPKQSQTKPISEAKNAAKSPTRRYSRGSLLSQILHCKKMLEREQLWLINS